MKYKLLFSSLAIPLLVGLVSSYFTINSIPTWYATLNKPFFNPPNFIFGFVWTTLYILMGISYYLVKASEAGKKAFALKLFFVQLGLNFLWSLIFFGLKSPKLAFLEVIVLWISIVFTIKYFYKFSKMAAYILIPYIFWVSLALFLNLSIVYLNP